MGDYKMCLKNGQKLRLAERLSQQVDNWVIYVPGPIANTGSVWVQTEEGGHLNNQMWVILLQTGRLQLDPAARTLTLPLED